MMPLRFGLYFLSTMFMWAAMRRQDNTLMFGAVLCLLWAIILKQVEDKP